MENGNAYGGKFCSPEEQQITTIGTGYVANFLSGEIISEGTVEKGGATLTNKRLYYSGQTFETAGLVITKKQQIVNVRDITGTGYRYYAQLTYLLYALYVGVLSIVGFVLGTDTTTDWRGETTTTFNTTFIVPAVVGVFIVLLLIVIYFVKRKTLFVIEYAGGFISFDVKWFSIAEQDNFIRNIQLVKDRLYSTAAIEQGFVGDDEVTDEIPDL